MRSLRTQLFVSHLVLVVFIGIATSVAIITTFRLSSTVQNLLQTDFQGMLAAQKLRDSIQEQQLALTMLLVGQRDAAQLEFETAHREFSRVIAEGRSFSNTPREDDAYDRLALAQRRLVTEMERAFASQSRIDTTMTLANGRGNLEAMVAATSMIFDDNKSAIVEANARAAREAQMAANRSVWITLIALGVAILLALRLTRVALNPLRTLADQAEVIGEGDLGRRLEFRRSDEIGELAASFNSMAERLQEARAKEERRLQRAERMSDAALESLYDPVVVTDAQARIVYLNRAAEGLFGPSPTTPRRPVVEHIGDQRIVRAITHAVREGQVSASEDAASLVPVHTKAGDRVYRLRATPMTGDDGALLGSVAVLEDVTHLKELDRLKTEFIGVASHELRTPVTSMLLSVQLLEEGAVGPLSDAQMEIVQAQKQDLQRLERLMRELLDMTRLEAGTAPPRFEWVPAEQLVHSAVQSLAAEARSKGVELSEETGQDMPKVRADRSQIVRVLVNLVSNAVRHTPPGGGVAARAIAGADVVLFEVEDSGSGIPAEYLARIFERFVQVPGATQGGAGLGLPIAQTIVHAHGGTIQVESSVGKGSVFRFALPTEAALAAPQSQSKESAP